MNLSLFLFTKTHEFHVHTFPLTDTKTLNTPKYKKYTIQLPQKFEKCAARTTHANHTRHRRHTHHKHTHTHTADRQTSHGYGYDWAKKKIREKSVERKAFAIFRPRPSRPAAGGCARAVSIHEAGTNERVVLATPHPPPHTLPGHPRSLLGRPPVRGPPPVQCGAGGRAALSPRNPPESLIRPSSAASIYIPWSIDRLIAPIALERGPLARFSAWTMRTTAVADDTVSLFCDGCVYVCVCVGFIFRLMYFHISLFLTCLCARVCFGAHVLGSC